jgi:citrate lyase subunit beta/citryl-CoA lyase
MAQLAQCPGLTLMLPKAERADTVAALRRACPGSPVLALIESARGVLAAERLAQCEGVARLAFGTIDFALDLDLPGDPIGLDAAGSLLALASRAAGLPAPVAGVTADINDETQLLADFARARALGFGAKMCIHPKQVAPLHAAMQPSAAQLEWARRVLAAASAAQGAVQLDGRMVDAPVIAQARRLLARAATG